MLKKSTLLAFFSARWIFFVPFLLALAGVLVTFLRLRGFQDPPGIDGYFYLKQAQTLALGQGFYFSDRSLAFLPLAFLRWATGEPVLSFQLALSLAYTLLFSGLLFLSLGVSERRPFLFIAQVVVVVALFSSSLLAEMGLNFYKNTFALGLLFWTAALLVRRQWWLAFALFCVAFFTHKSALLAGGLYVALLTLEWLRRPLRRKTLIGLGLGFLGCLVFLITFYLFFPKAEGFLRHLGEIWRGPELRFRWYKYLFFEQERRFAELAVVVALGLGYLWQRSSLKLEARRVGDCLLLMILVALHPFQLAGEESIGYRLALMTPALGFSLIFFYRHRYWQAAGLLVLLLPFYFSFFLGFSPGMVAKEVRAYSVLEEDVKKIPQFVNPEDHLISHHGLEFYVDYVTNIRSRSFLAAEGSTQKQYRVAYLPQSRFRLPSLRREVDQKKLLTIGNDFFLIREEDWQKIVATFRIPQLWRNPNWRRPGHVYE